MNINLRLSLRSPCSVSDLSAHCAYQYLYRLHATQHRCIETFRGWQLNVEWSTVWSNLRLWRFSRSVRDTSWLVAHAILPTADRLTRFGMAVDPLCHCGQIESLLHLFTECPLAQLLLEWYFGLVHRYSPNLLRPTAAQVLIGYARNVPIPPVFPALLGIIRHSLWCTRNAARFDGTVPDAANTLTRAKSSLRFLIRMQRRHCQADLFPTAWLANGVIGHINVAGELAFHHSVS